MGRDDRVWRKILRRDTDWLEKASLTTSRFSWSATYEHKLTLECGHVQIRTGYSDPPKVQVICKDCESGKPSVSTDGIEPGVFDRTAKEPPKGAKIVEALTSDSRGRTRAHERAQAQKRPKNYMQLSAREQWEVDKRLGILDYDGS